MKLTKDMEWRMENEAAVCRKIHGRLMTLAAGRSLDTSGLYSVDRRTYVQSSCRLLQSYKQVPKAMQLLLLATTS